MKRTWVGVGLAAVLAAQTGGMAVAGEAGDEAKAKHAAAVEAHKAKAGENRDKWQRHKENMSDEAKAKHAAAVEAKKDKAEENRDKWQKHKENMQEKAEARVDKREENQAKRIQHGISKGYLTADEIAKLTKQQQAIADMESAFKADGKLTKAEALKLRTELNEASRCIWAEKHDTEGNQMPAYRFGKNVYAKDEVTTKLADENLSAGEAKAILKDFRQILEIKGKLSSDDLTTDERAKLQAQYDDLLNQYFMTK